MSTVQFIPLHRMNLPSLSEYSVHSTRHRMTPNYLLETTHTPRARQQIGQVIILRVVRKEQEFLVTIVYRSSDSIAEYRRQRATNASPRPCTLKRGLPMFLACRNKATSRSFVPDSAPLSLPRFPSPSSINPLYSSGFPSPSPINPLYSARFPSPTIKHH